MQRKIATEREIIMMDHFESAVDVAKIRKDLKRLQIVMKKNDRIVVVVVVLMMMIMMMRFDLDFLLAFHRHHLHPSLLLHSFCVSFLQLSLEWWLEA